MLMISGFILYENFIDELTEQELITEIDAQPWIVDYDRRLQYYGYRNELEAPYDLVNYPVPIPPLMLRLSEEIVEKKLILNQPDQVIVNEYLPGQGIRPHKDRNYFANQICGVNLGSGCVMRFTKAKEVIDIEVPRRSMYVMQDDARLKWQHSIPPRKKDKVDGEIQHRSRRVSITYRKVVPTKVHKINPNGRAAEMLKKYYGISV